MVINARNVYCLVALEDYFSIVANIPPFAPWSTNAPLLLLLIACLDACILLGPYLVFRLFFGLLVATLLTLHSSSLLECRSFVSEGATDLLLSVGSDTRKSFLTSSFSLLAFESKEELTLIRPWENPPLSKIQLHRVADHCLEVYYLLQLLVQ